MREQAFHTIVDRRCLGSVRFPWLLFHGKPMQQPNAIPTVRIALEWYLNPDHLPLIYAQEQARAEGGLSIELVVPDDHYDGFEALAREEVQVVVNEPLHLLEKHAGSVALQALGTFFHTDGGVLITHDAQATLKSGGSIRVASPVSNPVTDGLCRDILVGWYKKQGVNVAPEQISVYEAGFDHVANLSNGADAAWLAFANIEGVHAQHLGLPVVMCSTSDGGVPGFSALELIADRNAKPAVKNALEKLVGYVNQAVPALLADPQAALNLWYRISDTEPSALTEAMVNDTLSRFVAPVSPDASRWRPIWEYMRAHKADVVDASTFEAIFQP